jgi:hypothetical protein
MEMAFGQPRKFFMSERSHPSSVSLLSNIFSLRDPGRRIRQPGRPATENDRHKDYLEYIRIGDYLEPPLLK